MGTVGERYYGRERERGDIGREQQNPRVSFTDYTEPSQPCKLYTKRFGLKTET